MKKSATRTSLFASAVAMLTGRPAGARRKPAIRPAPRSQASCGSQARALTNNPFRAAEIQPGECACDAVMPLTGMRYLLREVPLLPLRDCTERRCQCIYVRHRDRRDVTTDRRAEFSARTRQYGSRGNPERRLGGSRRASEDQDASGLDFLENYLDVAGRARRTR